VTNLRQTIVLKANHTYCYTLALVV